MRNFLLVILILGFSSGFAKEPQYAWWMNTSIDTNCSAEQSGTVVFRGTCYVLLTKNIVSRLPGYEQEDLSDTGAKFKLSFPEGPEGKYYATGVYKDREGKTGRVLIVARDPAFKEIIRAETREGIPGFSALFVEGNKLLWAFCLYCGDYAPVATKGQ